MIGFFPANAVGDDIEVYTDETRTEVLTTLHQLRQQAEHRDGRPAPVAGRLRRAQGHRAARLRRRLRRHRGARQRTSKIAEFKAALDDYSAILLESLADRLAEAFAERLHERVRTEFWGYAARRAPRQRGADRGEVRRHPARRRATRPARSTPRSRRSGSCSTSRRNTGIELTESMAMWPGAVGQRLVLLAPAVAVLRASAGSAATRSRTTRERKGWTLAEAERWLSPNLGYRTEDE